MRFSIVVPVFNSEKYIDKCLKSLLGQSFDDYQIILVDDGSTDESGKICDKAANLNKNVKVIHQDNKGQLAARIEGIKAAEGEYIVFCDSDDMLSRKALNVLDEKIKRYEPDGVVYRLRRMTAHGLIKSRKERPFDDYLINNKADLLRFLFSTSDYISMCLKCFRRELFKTSDFEQFFKYRIAEDFIQSIFLFENSNSVLVIPDELYYYRSNPDSVINRERRAEKYEVSYSISRFVFDFVKNRPYFTQEDFVSQKYYTVLSIIERLAEISNLPISFEKKTVFFEELKNDSFFKENIEGFDTSALGKNRDLYELFLSSDYSKLIKIEKRRTLFNRIKHHIAGLL